MSFLCILLLFSGVFGTTVTKIVDHGPDSSHVVFAIVGDGFVESEQSAYNASVDTIMDGFKQREPWKSYWELINVYRLNFISEESGYSTAETKKNTVFEGVVGNLPDVNNFILRDSLTKYLPQGWTTAMVMINYPWRIGVESFSIPVFGRGSLMESPIHEMGHAFADLADEYVRGEGTSPPDTAKEPNIALAPDIAVSGANRVKWWKWLTPGVSIPTPNVSEYDTVVGVFQGAKYSYGCYRAELQCMMRNGQSDYCRICTEALVLKMRELTSWSNGTEPRQGNTYYNNVPLSFSVNKGNASDLEYAIEWQLDYSTIENESEWSIEINPWNLGCAPHVLQAIVTDTTWYDYKHSYISRIVVERTRFVRNDPHGFMSDTITWYLQYKLDGPETMIGPVNVAWKAWNASGRTVRIRDNAPWELHGHRMLNIFDLRGRLVKSFSSNGGTTHLWEAPTAGVFFLRINNPESNTHKVVIK